MTRPMIVGLTGGIGSGKSAASGMFAALGVPVIDADEISRRLTQPGAPAFKSVLELFGPGALSSRGELRRDHIRKTVFDDAGLRGRLEAIIHPLVYAEIQRLVETANYPYCIVSVPLLLETGAPASFDRVLVIDVPEELQLRRTAARDGVSVAEAGKIAGSQATRDQRLLAANDVIRNDRDLEHLRNQVESLHGVYLKLARKQVAGSS